jgi:HPt (histidine-containing phosphotransfer) domain-containing protein
MIVAEPEAEAEFLELFRDEANERLDSLVDTLLALESGVADPDAINSVFRDAHTIKGGAAMVGLETVRDLAHVMEDVLAQVRTAGEFPTQLAEPRCVARKKRGHLAGDNEATPVCAARGLAVSPGSFQTQRTGAVAAPATAAAATPARPACRRKIDRLPDLVAETFFTAAGSTRDGDLSPGRPVGLRDELAGWSAVKVS